MPVVDTEKLLMIEDPLARAKAADKMMVVASEALSAISVIKGAAIRTLLETYTAEQVGNMLDIERTSVHRAAAKADPGNPNAYGAEARRLSEMLGSKLGLSWQEIRIWWNTTPQPMLNNRTPLQAWQEGDHASVWAIVESFPSA